MNKLMRSGLVALLGLGLLSCESRTDRTDGGGVLITISDFDGLPIGASVNAAVNGGGGLVQVDSITIRSVAKNPTGTTSDLMDVELTTYQVTYKRLDNGTRTPPALVSGIFGHVPVNGTNTIDNLPVLTATQLLNPPLSDMLLVNGGFDTETRSNTIVLEIQLTFFGRTLSGDAVQTQTVTWRMDFRP